MPVVFRCDCGKYLSVRSKNIGRRVRCPVCGDANRVPDPRRRKSRRIRNLPTRELEKKELARIREAHESGQDVALEEPELEYLDIDVAEKHAETSSAAAVSGKVRSPVTCLCGREMDVSMHEPGASVDCPECGREITIPGKSEDLLELTPIVDRDRCASCGVEIEENESVCHSCGKEIVQRSL